jgi:hypothetical protein
VAPSASLSFCLALAGCGFQLSFSSDGGASGDDAPADPDAMIDTDGPEPRPDAPDAAPPPALVDRGLVARYFIDEAATGTTATILEDSAPMPVNLPITFGQASFSETNGNRGLKWADAQASGKVELALGNTKLRTRIAGMKVTIEVVVHIDAAGMAGSESQITGLRGSNPDFMLTALGNGIKFFRPYGNEGATWAGVNMQERMVLHLVYDTTRQGAAERINLFKDGVAIVKTTGSAPQLNSSFTMGTSDDFMIGNRQGQDRSIAGTIFYVAYYDEALDATEIGTNAQRLLANDDT